MDRYVYLGLLLTEHLDFDLTAKYVAQSASRALGRLISKCKLAGGFPYNVFTKLYDSVVSPVINYGACIWGFKSYSCINAVQNRAQRFFLGVGKYTPVAALQGDMGWEPSTVKQWVCIGRLWVRMANTADDRLNKRIAMWAYGKASFRCRNWFYTVRKRLSDLQINDALNICQPVDSNIVHNLRTVLLGEFRNKWFANVHNPVGPSGRGGNKLHTYALFKTIFGAETYCKTILPLRHRSAFAKFRFGVAPLRI